MLKPRIPKLFTSIFFKLMVVILTAGVGINLAIIFFFGAFRHHISSNYQPHLNRYVDYLLKDIGDPPDQERARRIAADTDMVIAYEGQGYRWRTSDTPIDIPLSRMRIRHRSERMQAGSYHGAYVVYVQQGDGRFTFFLPHQKMVEKKIKVLSICLLIFISILMMGAYLMIRRVLKPLRWLKHGVEQVARGELSHRVPLKSSDELRDLSASFNTMTERLQQLIRSKEQLLLDVSHELRSPITRVKVTLALMAPSPERQSIEEDLMELEKKITELLETARALYVKTSLSYKPVDLVELIRKTVKTFAAGQPGIRMVGMPDLAPIFVDGELLAKALKNILDNAQKYSPDDAAPVEVSMAAEENEVIISIQDHGIGIPPEDLDFIFEPFYRVDKARTPRRDGFGLGLSLAKNIIEAHGGQIHVSSTPAKGTLVRVHLPLAVDTSEG
ncbi:MAG: HAMP domain-containing sensor histidine kinase [Desulfobacteraceae bacterium]|jgi:signal transduction histidine kinase